MNEENTYLIVNLSTTQELSKTQVSVNLESVVIIKNIDYKQKKPILGEIGYLNVQQNITTSSSKGKLFKHKNHKYIMDKQTELKAKAFDQSVQIETLVNERNRTLSEIQKLLLEKKESEPEETPEEVKPE